LFLSTNLIALMTALYPILHPIARSLLYDITCPLFFQMREIPVMCHKHNLLTVRDNQPKSVFTILLNFFVSRRFEARHFTKFVELSPRNGQDELRPKVGDGMKG
jgi:hypothetical protein